MEPYSQTKVEKSLGTIKTTSMNRESVNKGKQLRLVRCYRGYTQKELCKNIPKLSQSNLSKFEHGFEGKISNDILEQTMKFLKWPISFLSKRHPHIEYCN